MATAVHADLVDKLGRNRVLVGEEARRLCGLEPGAHGPVAVVRPISADQVEQAVKIGRLRHVAVLPRARFPVGTPDEVRDALVLDVGGLQRPPAIDIGRRTVTVGVGITAVHVDRIARQARLCLRTLPGWDDGERIGALVARGEPGELGLGEGALVDDVVGALVVSGGGRILQVGAAEVVGQPPWLAQGVAHPLGQLLASEGRLAVLCEVTLRLHPAPLVAWTAHDAPTSREFHLRAATLARWLLSTRLADTVLLREHGDSVRLDVRLVSWRSEGDLQAVAAEAAAGAVRHGLALGPLRDEPRRVRMGLQPGDWPVRRDASQPSLDLRVSWPDLAALLDLTSALYAEAGQPAQRTLAFGADSVRMRCPLGSLRSELHPLVSRAGLWLEAGAVPVGFGSQLRTAARDHMPTSTKVLLTALQRAWDPESVLSSRTGLL